ncbi:oxygen-insensitive NAD(P)H nitroreductase [Morganella morganii subsp. morganii]|uniref:oxygen-insensitive NAD(P)H nitroreductase n=1 Tax=Morganella morganii TaxID=582 RepID=UPI001BDA58EB|nr:oxygen-insensitive NAD(P)H nitroreductase [Morganella morganii]EKT0591946.1 oxygen-insensitive NAD(P)H nitroreductase [Morganella morganii]EKT0594042.1 oxygen-insensitive NAD(P)H nitroreductase [Morganella morganii]ELF0885358.1 oxygen-insensitive NAD(P)H nitroreductase [Morganella morganii]MBT0397017.1 oxygen-insensitive NAD(P)H nitroreductase [Morganella morganii subsp. morganii]HCR3196756.1 oxygen-insensitive NAD(P)H nitroreductase [Morganella morganii]
MTITQAVMQRYSTKSFDPAKKISDEVMNSIKTLLRYSPSSVNIQPWHFIIAASEEGKNRIAKSTRPGFEFNTAKITDASHVVLLCAKTDVDEAYMNSVLEQEDKDGRYATPEHKAMNNSGRTFFVNLHKETLGDLPHWAAKQVFLNMGTLLLGASALGVDAVPMEGMDFNTLDTEFGLSAKGLAPVAVVSLGYRKEDDFNAALPKSRLPEAQILTVI